MRRLLITSLVVFAASGTAVSAAPPPPDVPMITNEAVAFAPLFSLPSPDGCVFDEFLVDTEGNWKGQFNPGTILSFFYFKINQCTDQTLVRIATPDVVTIDASDLSFSPNLGSADLNVTLPAEDSSLGAPATLNLHWTRTAVNTGGLANGSATVTGTISSGSFSFALDNSIVWNPWASASFPQAVITSCVNERSAAVCAN